MIDKTEITLKHTYFYIFLKNVDEWDEISWYDTVFARRVPELGVSRCARNIV